MNILIYFSLCTDFSGLKETLAIALGFQSPRETLTSSKPKISTWIVVIIEKLSKFHCQDQTTAKYEGQQQFTKFEQNATNSNNSKSINSLTMKPVTTAIRLISIIEQIRRHWIWFLAINTPHFTTFHMPFGAHPAVKGFVANGALVS